LGLTLFQQEPWVQDLHLPLSQSCRHVRLKAHILLFMYRVFDNHLDDETHNSFFLAPEMANNAIHLSRHLNPLKLPITSCGQVMASVSIIQQGPHNARRRFGDYSIRCSRRRLFASVSESAY
jgi:hypothetical protein